MLKQIGHSFREMHFDAANLLADRCLSRRSVFDDCEPDREASPDERQLMKVHPPRDWSQNELIRLRAGANSGASAENIAKALGRHIAPVKRKARELRLILFKKVNAKRK